MWQCHIALDEQTLENGTLQYIPGSHRYELQYIPGSHRYELQYTPGSHRYGLQYIPGSHRYKQTPENSTLQ